MIEVAVSKINKYFDEKQELQLIKKITTWNNSDNNAFYEGVNVDGLMKLADIAGLASGCDLNVLSEHLYKAESILDAGAGYGRPLDYLLKHQFKGTITAIERSNTFFNFLTNNFGQYESVSLIHNDIRKLQYVRDINNKKFDLILMLWYGIADFSEEEQPVIFSKLRSFLKKGGKLIVDTIPDSTIPLSSQYYGRQNYIIHSKNTSIYVHLLKSDQITQYAEAAGFTNVNLIKYQTDTQRERWLYILD